MNLLFFSIISLLLPLASIADSPKLAPKKIVAAKLQVKPHRRLASAESLVNIKPLVDPAAIPLEPKIPPIVLPKPKGPTFFKLSRVPTKNQLILSFESYDPHLKLALQSPLAIELQTDYPLQLSRSLIMGPSWPKNGGPMAINFSEATPKIQNRIRGKASYTYCHNVTHKCKTVLDTILYYFIL